MCATHAKAKASLAAMFVGTEFSFCKPSPDLDDIKGQLGRGVAVQLTPTDIPDGNGGESRPEVVVAFFIVGSVEYRQNMRDVHGEHVTETEHESLFELGRPSLAGKRIMDALSAGCNAYLLPEEIAGVSGLYTLCILAS